jgi:ubiquinol oxidase
MTEKHHAPKDVSDKIALGFTKALRFIADTFFKKRYGHRAIVLETVAAVPGMVAGAGLHLKSLRRMEDDRGWIKELLDEADNERMHLMTFVELAQPNLLERLIILLAQAVFVTFYAIVYFFFPKTSHRIIGYFEEEAVRSYTEFLAEIDSGKIENVPAPRIAIDYWKLPENATLRDVVIVVREDEAGHRDRNHEMADELSEK